MREKSRKFPALIINVNKNTLMKISSFWDLKNSMTNTNNFKKTLW